MKGYCGYDGQPGRNCGATLYFSTTDDSNLTGDDTGLLMVYARSNSGMHFDQDYH